MNICFDVAFNQLRKCNVKHEQVANRKRKSIE